MTAPCPARKHAAEFPEDGGSVIEARARLGRLLDRMVLEAIRARARPGVSQTLGGLAEAVREPFLLVVVGAPDSGKRTFLSALFGEAVAAGSARPRSDDVLWFRHGEGGEERLASGVLVKRRPWAFLRDFTVVDAPGGAAGETGGRDPVREDILPAADLVAIVLSVTDPMLASTWSFLEGLHRVWLDRVVVVVQRCDLKAEGEVAEVAARVRGRMQATFGRAFPFFAVSARRAIEARRLMAGRGDEGREAWQRSGYPRLENHLRTHIGRFESRLLKLRNTVEAALRQVNGWPHGPSEADPALSGQEQLIRDLHERIDRAEREVAREIRALPRAVIRSYREIESVLPMVVENQLRVLPTLGMVFTGDRMPRRVEDRFLAALDTGGRECEERALRLLAGSGDGLWKSLAGLLGRDHLLALARAHGTSHPDVPALAREAVHGLRGQVVETGRALGLELILERALRARRTALRWLVAVAVLGVAGGGWAAMRGVDAGILGGIGFAALTLLAAAWVFAQQAVHRAADVLARGLEGGKGEVLRATEESLDESIFWFFDQMRSYLEPMEEAFDAGARLRGHDHALPPLRRELGQIAGRLDAWADAGEDRGNSRL